VVATYKMRPDAESRSAAADATALHRTEEAEKRDA